MRSLAAITALILLQTRVAAADETAADEAELMTIAGGVWHAGKLVPCADGLVTSVHSRLDEGTVRGAQRFESGVAVEFTLPTKPRFLNGQPFTAASVVHYDGVRGNRAMESEKVGDRVQICLVSFPTPTHDPQTGKAICDPSVDSRGMVYRIYDYKRHFAYVGPDSQHGCGGA